MFDFEERITAANRANEEAMPVSPSEGVRTYTADEIQDMLGIGRNAAYALIKKGYFRTVRVGRTYRVSKKSFDEWLNGGGETV